MVFCYLIVFFIYFYFDDCYIELMLKVLILDIFFYFFFVDLRFDKEVFLNFLVLRKEREGGKRERKLRGRMSIVVNLCDYLFIFC